MEAVVYYTNQ